MAKEKPPIVGMIQRGGEIEAAEVDLRDAAAVRKALAPASPSHVFLTTWLRQPTEAENCAVNGAMIAHVLEGLAEDARDLAHVALVTGLKHYLGPFEHFARNRPETPLREEQPRVPLENFYYVQEDLVLDAARRRGFSWSVHRPHTLIGKR